jgi:chromosome condensin MukBEF complex kleisin-like MukF subunit
MTNDPLNDRLYALEKANDTNESRLTECERLISLYNQMFRDIQSALRVSGDRFDNHQSQITNLQQQVTLERKRIDRVCDALINFTEGLQPKP